MEETFNSGIQNPALGVGLNGLLNSGGVAFFQRFIPNVIVLLLVVGALIFFFMLVVGAIQWISSGGDKQALEGARGKITSALTGLVILFATFAVMFFIEGFFGIKILTLDIAPLVIK